jgi:folate-binding Fe-S cluster repair protein YgfZ
MIPAEGGQALVDAAVSFTKGCYTGQELVARVDSRGGNVPRRLLGVVVEPAVVPPVGATLGHDGKAAGTLTSVAESPRRGAVVALALVARHTSPGDTVAIEWDGGGTTGTVAALPLAG